MRMFLTVLASLAILCGALLAVASIPELSSGGLGDFIGSLLLAVIGGVLWILTEISRQMEASAASVAALPPFPPSRA